MMVPTFAQARQQVFDAVAGTWNPELSGTLFIGLEGLEDHEYFLVTVGPREWLVDGDVRFSTVGTPMSMFVDKATGSVRWFTALPGMPEWERRDSMSWVRSDE